MVAILKHRIAKIEARMAELVAADPEMATLDRRLRIAAASPPSQAWPPLRATAASAWAAVSSAAADPSCGRCFYIAALRASRRCAAFKEFHACLQGAGKPVKAALVAIARKLLVTLIAMLAASADYRRHSSH